MHYFLPFHLILEFSLQKFYLKMQFLSQLFVLGLQFDLCTLTILEFLLILPLDAFYFVFFGFDLLQTLASLFGGCLELLVSGLVVDLRILEALLVVLQLIFEVVALVLPVRTLSTYSSLQRGPCHCTHHRPSDERGGRRTCLPTVPWARTLCSYSSLPIRWVTIWSAY